MNQFTVRFQKSLAALRTAPWRVRGILNGKAVRNHYWTRERAELEARALDKQVRANGEKAAACPAGVIHDALEGLEIIAGCPGNATLIEACKFYARHHDVRAKSILVSEAWKQYIPYYERRVERGEVRSKSWESVRKVVAHFERDNGESQVCDWAPLKIKGWLDGLKTREGKPFSVGSINSYRLNLSGFFTFCVDNAWLAVHPMKDKKVRALRNLAAREKLPEIFTVEQLTKLLEVAQATDPQIIVPIVLGAFAGIRPTEAWKMDWSMIKWDRQIVDVPASIAKTADWREVPISPNLREWLAPYRKEKGPVFAGRQANLIARISAAGKAIGVTEWPEDVLRHSYGSFHYAATENVEATIARMGHKSGLQIFFKHYRNRRSKEEGKAYFEIRPQLVPLPQLAAA